MKRGLVVGFFVLMGMVALPASALATPQVNPDELRFPVTPLNVESAPMTITVSNPSAAPLVFGEMAFYNGNDNPQFSFDRTNCGASLAEGQSCDITVKFKPTFYWNLHYKELGIGFTGFSTVYVSLIGSTPNPDGEISPDTAQDFGSAIAGFPADAKTKTFTLSSTGERDLTLTDLYAFNFSDLNFSVEPSPCLAVQAPGASCEFEVTFSPEETSSGLLDATLTAQWEDPELHTLLVDLTGTATTANYTAAPATADFGEAEVGTGLTADRTPKSFTITSTGDGGLPFAGAEITGADAGSFSLETPACPARIAPTKACPLVVTFDPETGYDGPRAATLKVKAGINDSKYTAIPLTGTATGNPVPPPPPPPGKAKLGLKLKSKKTVKRGKTLIVKATVSNTGEATAQSIVLKAKLPKKLVKKVKAIKIASLAPGKSVTRKIKIKVKRTAKRGKKLQLKVNAQAPGAIKASAKRTVKIK